MLRFARQIFLSVLILFFFISISVSKVSASSNSRPAITIINLVRSNGLGHEKDDLFSSLKDQWKVTKDLNVNATWLLQYGTLEDKKIVGYAKKEMSGQEFGLLFEIDRNFAEKSGVAFKGQRPWYASDGLFLVSYDVFERRKLVDSAFAKFKEQFGYYPKTVGAWWMGADALTYMQEKYGIVAALKASDQYDLDFYSIWGSPYSVPYVSSKTNEAIPGSSIDDSSKVVILQWAARDPLKGLNDPLFSLQDFPARGQGNSYFNYLANVYLQAPTDNLLIGLENGGNLEIFGRHYKSSIVAAKDLEKKGKISIQTAEDFANNFLKSQKVISRPYILSQDFSSNDQSFWYFSENFRASIQKLGDKIYLVDLHKYSDKLDEDYSFLPNTSANLRVDSPAIIDDLRYQDKILLVTSKNPLQVEDRNGVVSLFTKDQKIATFKKDSISLNSNNQKTFDFNSRKIEPNIIYIFICLYIIYSIIVFLKFGAFSKGIIEVGFILIPLIFAFPFLSKSPNFVFDKKEFFLFYIPNIFYSISTFLIFIKVLPFLLLIAAHFFLKLKAQNKKSNILFYTILFLTAFMYFHVPYFPLDRSTYKLIFLTLGIPAILLLVISFLIYREFESKKFLIYSAIFIIGIIPFAFAAILISRSRFVITPFELEALQEIRNQNKDVVLVYQAGVPSPIYREVRPLIYDNYQIAQNLTQKKWNIQMRPEDRVLKGKNFGSKLIYIPRYLGSDLSAYEMKTLKLRKTFDNVQIAFYEKK